MYTNIMVPLDRSGFSERAIPCALGVAQATGASVHLALVHSLPGLSAMAEVPGGLYEEVDEQIRHAESSYLETLAARLGGGGDGPAVRPRLLDGPVVQALQQYVRDGHVDLIVMSTHGHGGLKRSWLGSITDSLLRRVEVPLLLVRPGEDGAVQDGTPSTPTRLEHVVAAVDGSELAEGAAQHAADLARAAGAKLTLLRIVKPSMQPSTVYLPDLVRLNREQLEREEAEATEYLGSLASRLRDERLRVGERAVVDYHSADAILREATDLGADLIAVGTHGHGGVRRMVLGSVADKVIRGSALPVFVLPSRGAETK